MKDELESVLCVLCVCVGESKGDERRARISLAGQNTRVLNSTEGCATMTFPSVTNYAVSGQAA